MDICASCEPVPRLLDALGPCVLLAALYASGWIEQPSCGLSSGAGVLHDDLHDWSNGLAAESQMAADWDLVVDAHEKFKQPMRQAQFLNQGDDTLDALFDDINNPYKDLDFGLRKDRRLIRSGPDSPIRPRASTGIPLVRRRGLLHRSARVGMSGFWSCHSYPPM